MRAGPAEEQRVSGNNGTRQEANGTPHDRRERAFGFCNLLIKDGRVADPAGLVIHYIDLPPIEGHPTWSRLSDQSPSELM